MDDQPKEDGANQKIQHVYPLIRHSDMTDEMRLESVEMISTACEKYQNNYETAAKSIKEAMDKRFGSYWHVVVGEGFGFEISFETKHILYLFFGGNLAIVLWKCS